MAHPFTTLAIAVSLGLATAGAARAADAAAASAPGRPVTGVRIGGSPADARFRAAQQKSGQAYRTARAACRKQPTTERAACIKAAGDKLRDDRAAAAAAHRSRP